ncbi:hypothetical protein [Pedobacter sp. R20-19]|uniref:hypothetical protein n=1 Tax=Pedobacter sp. R20-19 TaxID=1270196 RepID=UPI000492FF0F|nr:hypothetical protein [Pedobacter sp. R20-19]
MSTSPRPVPTHLVKCHLHTLKFVPYNGVEKSNADILIEAITFLNNEKLEGKAFLVDKNKNRDGEEPRELFMHVAYRIPAKRIIRCSLALIRGGKVPMLKPKDTYELVPFNKTDGTLTELTNFFIDFNRSPAVVCVEYNHNGPRITDIEFYFRQIAYKVLRIAKTTTVTQLMRIRIDEAISSLKNVLNFDIKMRPKNVTYLDNEIKGYVSEFATIGQKLQPNFIRVEALFQTPGGKIISDELNVKANNMFMTFLKKFKSNPENISQFENFEVKFVNTDGEDDVFNLIKGKAELLVEIESLKQLTAKEWYELIEEKYADFIEVYYK